MSEDQNDNYLNSLSIYYQNAHSIKNKLQDFTSLLFSNDNEVILLTETWLHDDCNDIYNIINGSKFSYFCKNRTNREGGGVIALIAEHLSPSQLSYETDLEIIIVKVSNPQPFIIVCFYNPPNNELDWFDDLSQILISIISTYPNTPLILTGDFNVPRWKPDSIEKDNEVDILIKEFDLLQHIKFPTRESNYLDLLFSKYAHIIDVKSESWFKSDHIGFNFIIKFDNCLSLIDQSFCCYNYYHAPWTIIIHELASINEGIFPIQNPIVAYNTWYQAAIDLIEKQIPKITIKKKFLFHGLTLNYQS